MIRIPRLPNPIAEAVSSYNINNTGKAVFGSLIGQVITSMMNTSRENYSKDNDWEEMIYHFEEIAQSIQNSQENINYWNNLDNKKRKQLFIDIFYQKNLGYLVPLLSKELNKYFL